jgi:hypothetical protein
MFSTTYPDPADDRPSDAERVLQALAKRGLGPESVELA